MCTNGYENNSGLPTSTTSSSGAMFIFRFLLTKLIRLGREVLLAYQSPPPPYLSLAILYAGFCAKADTLVNNDKGIMNISRYIYFVCITGMADVYINSFRI